MSDDLRTRAREAADDRYREPAFPDEVLRYATHAVRYREREAYVAGYLAHAAQQPSREQLMLRLEREFGAFLAHDPADPDRFYGQIADAMLAPYENGAGS